MIKQRLATNKKSKWINTTEYIILHHTAENGSLNGVLSWLSTSPSSTASAHFVVDFNGDIYQIGEETDILWHAGVSSWNGKQNLNRYSIGIEIRGINAFTNEQRIAVRKLVNYLIKKYNIPKENILRHKDIAPGRKNDVHDNFWNNEYKTYSDYINSYFDNMKIGSQHNYADILKQEIAQGFETIYKEHAGDALLTEKEIKELQDIYGARMERRIMEKVQKMIDGDVKKNKNFILM